MVSHWLGDLPAAACPIDKLRVQESKGDGLAEAGIPGFEVQAPGFNLVLVIRVRSS